MRRLPLVTCIVLGPMLGLVAAVGWFGSNPALRPPWYEHRTPDQGLRPVDPEGEGFIWEGGYRDPGRDLGLAYESVEIPGPDGSTLRGWLVPAESRSRGGIVAVHGGGADRREFLRHVPMFHRAGLPVVLFDCREQGVSDGHGRGISLGMRESADVSSVAAWARLELGWQSVAVIGTSQGGASVILAAAADPSIDVVIAENPFTSIHDLVRDVSAVARPIPGWAVALVANAAILRMEGIGALSRPSPIDVVDRIAPRPLLLMHGSADVVVPVEHSKRLAAAAGDSAELWILEGAGHAALFNRDPDAYETHVIGFLEHYGLLDEP